MSQTKLCLLTAILIAGNILTADAQLVRTDDFHEKYTLTQTVVLSRHNIRSPLSTGESLLGRITPHQWFDWSSASSELSLRGGVLETMMGQFFRKWLVSEGLISENEQPAEGAMRFYANSMQRTIATAQYFSSGFLPVANVDIEHHYGLGTMDPVFTPQLTVISDEYRERALKQIVDLFGGGTFEGIGEKMAGEMALIESVIDIPTRLVALFPTEKTPSFTPALIGDCMRGIVEQWDDEFVYVQTEESTDGELRKVCYAHGNQNYNYPWSYLKVLFRKGTQLNLVRPREDNGIIYPELIIYEPDFLVNISTVANCFTNYADSPYVELIKKLEPQANSDAIVLGNFAGQLLDEAIHQLPLTHDYRDSAKDFFYHQAVSLLTLGDSAKFHQDGKRQQYNIIRAVHYSKSKELLTRNTSRFFFMS